MVKKNINKENKNEIKKPELYAVLPYAGEQMFKLSRRGTIGFLKLIVITDYMRNPVYNI
jgi:hypothetical protein